jgi:ABC-type lipoprotein release transport system permease subunit
VLFGVSVRDPMTLATAVLGIALSAAMAAVIPGFRASRIDPMTTLRHE